MVRTCFVCFRILHNHTDSDDTRVCWWSATVVADLFAVHRIEKVTGDDPSPRVVLTMWFTTSAAHKEAEADSGFMRRQSARPHGTRLVGGRGRSRRARSRM